MPSGQIPVLPGGKRSDNSTVFRPGVLVPISGAFLPKTMIFLSFSDGIIALGLFCIERNTSEGFFHEIDETV
jgi:hypothetical protein